MKKLIILFIIISLPWAAYPQSADTSIVKLPVADSLVQYERVVALDRSVKKEIVFNAVRNWIAARHTDPANVIKVFNKTTGQIVGIEGLSLYVGKFIAWKFNVLYTFEVKIRDTDYQILIKNIKRDFANEKYQNKQTIIYEPIEKPYFNLLNQKKDSRNARYDKLLFSAINKNLLDMMDSIETFVNHSINNQ